jgi:purine-nucleoside phosphorylase/ASC-1-like (ASCH) protein
MSTGTQMRKEAHLTGKDLMGMVQLTPEAVGKYAIVPGPVERMEAIKKKLENPVKNFTFMEYSMYTGTYQGIKLTTINGGRFAADTAITTEILCNAGVKAMLRAGSCGALREDIKVGDIIIATSSVKGEGVTQYYVGKDYVPTADKKLTDMLVVSSTKKQSDNLGFLTDIAHQIIESNAESIQMMSAVLYIVTNTSDIADQGGQYLELMLQSMAKIQENAKQMQGIIEMIDTIADQTNLLSLNASIESARAGSAGLGFSVVAREISKLAEQSAESTKGINQLVKQTNSIIQKGNENVTEGGETFKKIIKEVGNIDNLVNSVDETMKSQTEIYNTFREKIEQINDEAIQITHITTEQMHNVNSVMDSINQLNRDFINLLTVQNTNGK